MRNFELFELIDNMKNAEHDVDLFKLGDEVYGNFYWFWTTNFLFTVDALRYADKNGIYVMKHGYIKSFCLKEKYMIISDDITEVRLDFSLLNMIRFAVRYEE